MEINLLDLMVKIGIDDKVTSGVEKVASKVKGAFGAIGRTAAAGVAAAATAVGALGSQALGMYASYEQNVGGIQKLFGNMGKSLEEYAALTGQSTDECAGKWQQLEQAQTTALSNAGNAWQTAGMSANQYMEQVTGFSAALITSLGNDTNAAADYANMAMVDMSDNANTFGTDMQSLQWAYQGFAKQNYTMLDNLKLGYGGTKEEMERLISDANRVKEANGEMADLSIDSFADVTEAIHIIQEQMNIAGTTAREASTTIEGSVNAMKAAWENWLTGLGDDSADMKQLTENLVQSFETAAGNVVPRMAVIIGTLIGQVPGLVSQLGPVAAQAVGDIFAEALRGIYDALPAEAQQKVDEIAQSFQASGLAESLSGFLGAIADFGARAAEGIGQLASKFDEMGAMEAQAAVLDTVGALLGSIADTASEYLLPALEFLGERFGELFAAVGEAQVWLEPIASFLGEVLVAVLVTLVDAVSAVVAVFTGLIETVTAVVEFFMAAPASIQAFVTSVAGFFSQLPGIVGGFLASVIGTVAGWVGSMVSSAASAGSGFISSVVGFLSQLPGNVSGFLSSVIGAVAGWAGQMASQAAQAASSFGSSLIDGLYGIVGSAMSAGQAIVQGVIDGITGMIGSAGAAIGSVVDTIASYLPHSPAKRGAFSGKGWTPYSGKAIVQGLAEGIEAAGDSPTEATAGVMGRVRSAIGEGGAGIGGSISVGSSGESVIAWLAANLPAIIADYTPVMGEKDFGRKVRKAVAYA
ncbi:phage tail protein [Senegalimassilia anaerobia]|uniref:phage tail protein n=1 Tax=Senegalimassilia anaerobia TaxID=1473216 RepID=UPI00248F0B3A|nr:hypothetical protein [Senegalimassilia anaerobia]